MATTGISTAPVRSAQSTMSVYRMTGALLLAQFILMYVTVGILGSAINWPASLDEPASVMLPLIIEQSGAVALGYTSYFISSLLLGPIALLVYHIGRNEGGRAVLLVATGLGLLASFAKLLGIARWLVLMPALASTYVDPQASAASRDAIAVVYEAFNNYAGGVGETLGVALLSGLWTALVSLVALRGSTALPRWLGIFGLVSAALLVVSIAGVYGVDPGPILIIQGIVWQFWMLALAIVLLRVRRTA